MTSADGCRRCVDGDVVLRRVWQFARWIGREDQNRRAGPAERAGDRWTDRHERGRDRIGNPAEYDHRLREDDPDFVRLAEVLNFVRWPTLNNGQRGRLLRGRSLCSKSQPEADRRQQYLRCHTPVLIWSYSVSNYREKIWTYVVQTFRSACKAGLKARTTYEGIYGGVRRNEGWAMAVTTLQSLAIPDPSKPGQIPAVFDKRGSRALRESVNPSLMG